MTQEVNARNKSIVVANCAQLIGLLFVFALSLAIRLWFNFSANHVNVYASCDAWEYLNNASSLETFCQQLSHVPHTFSQQCLQCLTNSASPSVVAHVHSMFQPLNDFYIAGPIFPIFLLSCFKSLGMPFSATNWLVPLSAYSLISALVCILVAIIGKQAWDFQTGILAGIICAVYPGFIVNSGRLYPETLAVFLLLATILITVLGFQAQGNMLLIFLQGILAACLQLSRSIMVILSCALVPITVLQRRYNRPVIALAVLALGFFLIMCPWLAWQKLAFGHATMVVNRVGHYNFFVGNNIASQGWLSVPYPDGRGIEQKSFFQLGEEAVKQNPLAFVKLFLDKGPRLFKCPWNDFRCPVGPSTYDKQVAFHQLILIFAVVGLSLTVTSFLPGSVAGQLPNRFFLFTLIIIQLVYLFFITVPRYNLTIMPLVITFAAAGATTLYRLMCTFNKAPWMVLSSMIILFLAARTNWLTLIRNCQPLWMENHILLSLALACIMKFLPLCFFAYCLFKQKQILSCKRSSSFATSLLLALLVPAVCLPLRAHGRWWEWQQELSHKGQSLSQTILLPRNLSSPLSSRQCFLLIDSDGIRPLMKSLSIQVNGTHLHSPVIPGLSFMDNLDNYLVRQEEIYLEREDIFASLCRASNISNCDLRQWFLLPLDEQLVADACKSGRLCITLTKTDNSPLHIFGGFRTNNQYSILPAIDSCSWEKAFYGVESDEGLTDPRYDMKLALSPTILEKSLPSSKAFLFVRLLAVNSGSQITQVARQEAQTITSNKTQLISLLRLPAYKHSDLWLIRSSGTLLSCKNTPSIKVKVYVRNQKGQLLTYVSPFANNTLGKTGTEAQSQGCPGQEFDLAFPLHPAHLPGKVVKIECLAQGDIRNLSLQVSSFPNLPTRTNTAIY